MYTYRIPMLDVLTLSPFIVFPNVYLTCRHMYALWPAARDTAIHAMILAHQADQANRIKWGDVSLVRVKGTTRRTSCCMSKHVNTRCGSRACSVYEMRMTRVIINMPMVHCTKIDIINGIEFVFTVPTCGYSAALDVLKFPSIISSPCCIIINRGADRVYAGHIHREYPRTSDGRVFKCSSWDSCMIKDDHMSAHIKRVLAYIWSPMVDSIAYLGADFWGSL